jgi:N-acyl-D-aspartate/D-glutamate deacylase
MRGRLALLALLFFLHGCDRRTAADWIVYGATVVDGSGVPSYVADIVGLDGRIVELGDATGWRSERRIDGIGLIAAPGFIDLHSHADLILLSDRATQERLLEAKIRQGVTTLIVGNCGLGPAPADEETAAVLAGVNGWMTPEGTTAPALDMAGYFERLERNGIAVNAGSLLPHGPLRFSVRGTLPGAANATELEAMRAGAAAALDAGAFGLSVGLIYPPGMTTPTAELRVLAGEVSARGRLFTAHVRGSSELLLPATDELLAIARDSGARVHHAHLEAVGEAYWPRIADVLAREDAARADGLDVSHGVFLYTRAATMMSAIFPPWSLEGGVPALLERLRDPATRARIRDEIETHRPEWPPWGAGGWPHNLVGAVGWDGILLASLPAEAPQEWIGSSLAEIGGAENRDPFDVVADLMLAWDGRVGQLVAEISGSPDETAGLRSIFRHPAALVVSDAEDYGRGVPHPAHAGAFARALRWGIDAGLPLPDVVRKMSGLPAERLGLRERGIIRRGFPADLVLFDPRQVRDTADWRLPRAHARGVRYVSIGGDWVVDDGRFVGGARGSVLRAGRD